MKNFTYFVTLTNWNSFLQSLTKDFETYGLEKLEKDLFWKQASFIVIGIEHPHRNLFRSARFYIACDCVVIIKAQYRYAV